MDEKATDDVRSRLVDGGECQKLPRHSKGASQDPYNIERNGRRDGGAEGQLERRQRKDGRGPFVTDWARRFRPSARRAHFAGRGRSKGRTDGVLAKNRLL